MSEVVDVAEARRLTERIRLIAGNIADNVEKLRDLVQQAKDSQVHVALGYASWTAYLKDVFGDEPLRLARDVRQELVAELAAQGMSTRAIAPIVGVGDSTVQRDLAGAPHGAPAAEQVIEPGEHVAAGFAAGLRIVVDADTIRSELRPADETPAQEPEPERVEDARVATVTGLDGKTYTRPAAQTPRRASIADEARNAGWQLRKAVERIQKLSEDDRFGKNKAEVMAALQPHLDFANEVISDL